MTKLLERLLGQELGTARDAARNAAYGIVGRSLAEIVSGSKDSLRKEYLERRLRNAEVICKERLRGYEEELAEAAGILEGIITSLYTECRKAHDIALIEHPMLEHRLREGLGRKGVPFLFRTNGPSNILTIRVVGTHFMEIRIDPDNVDRVILLAPYLIRNPHRAGEEFPRRVTCGSRPDLARRWDEVSIGGQGTG